MPAETTQVPVLLFVREPTPAEAERSSDNFSDWKRSAEWMRTSSDFAANPIGTFFDPSRVYEKLQSGAGFKTLQPAVRAGAYLPDPIPNIGLPTP